MRPVPIVALTALALAGCKAEGTTPPRPAAEAPPKPVQVAEVRLAPGTLSYLIEP